MAADIFTNLSPTTSVAYAWYWPTGVDKAIFEAIGASGVGGQGGVFGVSGPYGGGGGGGGGYGRKLLLRASVSDPVYIRFPAAAVGSAWQHGGDSRWTDGGGSTTYLHGGGGQRGDLQDTGLGGAGGGGSGDVWYSGGDGGDGYPNAYGGGGGASADPTGDGADGDDSTSGASGAGGVAVAPGGDGHDGGTGVSTGFEPGGGAGGQDAGYGSTADGVCGWGRVTYYAPLDAGDASCGFSVISPLLSIPVGNADVGLDDVDPVLRVPGGHVAAGLDVLGGGTLVLSSVDVGVAVSPAELAAVCGVAAVGLGAMSPAVSVPASPASLGLGMVGGGTVVLIAVDVGLDVAPPVAAAFAGVAAVGLHLAGVGLGQAAAETGLSTRTGLGDIEPGNIDIGLSVDGAFLTALPCPLGLDVWNIPMAVQPGASGVAFELHAGKIFGNGDWPPFGGLHSIPFFEEVRPMELAVSKAQMRKIIDAVMGATFWKSGDIEVRLFTNDITPDKNTVEADLTEATFDGYTAITTAAFAPAVYDNDDNAVAVGDATMSFTCTGDTTPETVRGVYLVDGQGLYIGAQRFDEDQNVVKAGDNVSFTLRVGYPEIGSVVVEA